MCKIIQKLLISEIQKPRAMLFVIFLKFLLQEKSNIDGLITMLFAFKGGLQNSIGVSLKTNPIDHIKQLLKSQLDALLHQFLAQKIN